MPNITFKAKVETVHNPDDTVAYRHVKVPKIGTRHCDMHAFRIDLNYGPYSNSDLFPGMITRAVKRRGIGSHIRLDQVPPDVTIDTSGFLAVVTITV